MMVKSVLWSQTSQNSAPDPDTQYVTLGRLCKISEFQFVCKMSVILWTPEGSFMD